MDNLAKAIHEKGNPISVRINASVDTIPPSILGKEIEKRWMTPNAIKEAMVIYSKIVIDSIKDMVPSITIPTDNFMMYGFNGMEALMQITRYANEAKLIVIEDANLSSTTNMSEIIEFRLGTPSIDKLKHRVFFNDFITISPYSNADVISKIADYSRKEKKYGFIVNRPTKDLGIWSKEISSENGSIPLYMKIPNDIKNLSIFTDGGFYIVGVSMAFSHPNEIMKLRMDYPTLFIHIRDFSNIASIKHLFKHKGIIVDSDIPFLAGKDPSYEGLSMPAIIRQATLELIQTIKE